MKATLYRFGGVPWKFEFDKETNKFAHRTNRGSIYIMLAVNVTIPRIRIYRMHSSIELVDVTTKVGSAFIRFHDGSSYHFK